MLLSKVKIISIIGIGILLFSALNLTYTIGDNTEYGVENDVEIFTISESFSNVYVIKFSNGALLVDSGNPNKAEKIVAQLKKIGISPSEIDYLILTHAHPDHAGNARYFQKKHGIKVIAGSGELEIINTQGEDHTLCPTGFLGKIVAKTIAQKRYPSFVPDLLIKVKFDLRQIGFEGSIIPVAGHTPGSLVVKIGEAVFVGDIIRGKSLNKTKPTRHIFICDFGQNLKNIERISKLKNVRKWYPGHSGPFTQRAVTRFINKEKSK